MSFALLIIIGSNVYNYDHLSYVDLETCEYHRERVYDTFRFNTFETFKVECYILTAIELCCVLSMCCALSLLLEDTVASG